MKGDYYFNQQILLMNAITFDKPVDFVNYFADSCKDNTFIADIVVIKNDDTRDDYSNRKQSTTIETIIIKKLVLENCHEIHDLFRYFDNLKVLIISDIRAENIINASSMFADVDCDYVEVNISLPMVKNVDFMFANNEKIQTAKLNIKLNSSVESAVGMFADWHTLTPNIIDTLITYNADISNIFHDCSFEKSLLEKLDNNNKRSKLSTEQKQTSNIEDIITSSINKLIIPKINSLCNNNKSIEEAITNSFGILTSKIDSLTKLTSQFLNIEEKLSSTVKSSIDIFTNSLNEVKSTIDTNNNQLNNSIKSSNQGLQATVNSLSNITNYTSRLSSVVEAIDKRVQELERPAPVIKFTKDEVKDKVIKLIKDEIEKGHISSFTEIPTKEFADKIYNKFQTKYGWDKIEFVVLRRIIEEQCHITH